MTDEEALRQLVARWAQHLDDGAWDELRSLHTADTTLTVLDSVCNNADEVVDMLSTGMPPGRRGRHLVCGTVITVDGDHGSSVTDFLYINNQSAIQRVGRYLDEFVRRDGTWLIERRAITHMPPDA